MTPEERRKQHIINGSRRKRIAKGSGTSVEDVNRLLKQFVQMQKMLKQLGGMAGLATALRRLDMEPGDRVMLVAPSGPFDRRSFDAGLAVLGRRYDVAAVCVRPCDVTLARDELAGSSTELSDAIAKDPIGALAATLPTWFLVPFAVVAACALCTRKKT